MTLADFHVHTTFCDGRDSAEDVVRAAISLGMSCLGFSGHAHTPFDEGWCMSIEGTEAYCHEVARLRAAYAGQIEILCGVEQDMLSDLPPDGYDYVIGSAHYLTVGVERCPVDAGPAELRSAVERHFGGDPYALAEAYYRQISHVVERTGADVIGHFDLLTKFNEIDPLFDEEHPRYVAASDAALDALLATGRPFEINTGAISRGYRTTPYPGPRLLRRIVEHGGLAILSSDSHRADTLCFQFEKAQELAASLGLTLVDRPRPARGK